MREKISVSPAGSGAACALALTMLLGACESREGGEKVRSAEWYEAHPVEREQKLAECMSSTSSRDASPDCVNASRAENTVKNSTRWGTPRDEVRTEPPISR